MSDIADDVKAILAAVNALTTAVAAIPTIPVTPPAPTIDFTPVLNAIAGVQTTANAIAADLVPTPAPTPAA